MARTAGSIKQLHSVIEFWRAKAREIVLCLDIKYLKVQSDGNPVMPYLSTVQCSVRTEV